MYRLGLDIGTTSVGAAILNIDHYGEPNRIIDMHVRTFEAAENPNDVQHLAERRGGLAGEIEGISIDWTESKHLYRAKVSTQKKNWILYIMQKVIF